LLASAFETLHGKISFAATAGIGASLALPGLPAALPAVAELVDGAAGLALPAAPVIPGVLL
jgi:hypothetical protein